MPINSSRRAADVDFDRLRRLHARVVHDTVTLVRRIGGRDDLARPTPCAAWTLGDLLAHMTAQHRGFAAAALGHGGERAHWRVRPCAGAGEAVARYGEAAEEVVTAFTAVGSPDRPFALPEFTSRRTFPAALAVGFHFLDYVVHGWDVARALELPYDPGSDVLEAALPLARAVPDGDELRPAEGGPFGPALPAKAGGGRRPGTLDLILAMLGRSPEWRGGHGGYGVGGAGAC